MFVNEVVECFNIEEGVGGKPGPVDKFVRQHMKFLYFLEVGGLVE